MKRILLTATIWVVSIIVSVAALVTEQAAMLAAQKFIHQQMPAMSRGKRIELTRAFTAVADGEGAGIYVTVQMAMSSLAPTIICPRYWHTATEHHMMLQKSLQA